MVKCLLPTGKNTSVHRKNKLPCILNYLLDSLKYKGVCFVGLHLAVCCKEFCVKNVALS